MNTFIQNVHPEELENNCFPCYGCPFDDPSERDCQERCPRNDPDFIDYDDEPDQFMSDVEADADALASAGLGTDEDYGYYGEDEW